MAQRSIQGSADLAGQIKRRRNELKLTIEEAASRAGVGTKTWCRYEAGESIRQDKCKGVCKALNWSSFPDQDEEEDRWLSIEECKKRGPWSTFLEENYGPVAALSFAAGSDIVWDKINDDMRELTNMPAGTHIGQLSASWLADDLPEQFLMRYDYEFLYRMRCTLIKLRRWAKAGSPMTAHSVMEELLLYLCNEEAKAMIELSNGIKDCDDKEELDYIEEWVFDLFEDMDVVTFLYSDLYVSPDHTYHYSRWDEQQFFMG